MPQAPKAGGRGKGDYAHFVTYMLGIIDACYRELANRLSLAGAPSGNEGAFRAFFDRLIGSATKREIMDANPGMSQRTLGRILSKLQQEGLIEKNRRRTIDRISTATRLHNAMGVTQLEARYEADRANVPVRLLDLDASRASRNISCALLWTKESRRAMSASLKPSISDHSNAGSVHIAESNPSSTGRSIETCTLPPSRTLENANCIPSSSSA